jgi:hypothetical protein
MSEKYLKSVQSLLPGGPAFTRDADAKITKLLKGLATELGRVDGRAVDLLDESDPRTASETLADWERVYGITTDTTLSDAVRRDAILAKIASQEVLTEPKALTLATRILEEDTYSTLTVLPGDAKTIRNAFLQVYFQTFFGDEENFIFNISITHGEASMSGEMVSGGPVADDEWESFFWVDVEALNVYEFILGTHEEITSVWAVAKPALLAMVGRLLGHEKMYPRLFFLDANGDRQQHAL